MSRSIVSPVEIVLDSTWTDKVLRLRNELRRHDDASEKTMLPGSEITTKMWQLTVATGKGIGHVQCIGSQKSRGMIRARGLGAPKSGGNEPPYGSFGSDHGVCIFVDVIENMMSPSGLMETTISRAKLRASVHFGAGADAEQTYRTHVPTTG